MRTSGSVDNRNMTIMGMLRQVCFVVAVYVLFVTSVSAQNVELVFDDYDNQGVFNNFSGDRGAWFHSPGLFQLSFDTANCRSNAGACLRLDYSVPSGGYGGVWNSLIGKVNYTGQTLNFQDLYGALKNSSGNPTDIATVRVTHFNFWAKGNGNGVYDHTLKVEFKDNAGHITSKSFTIPNTGGWTQYSFSVSEFANPSLDLTTMKEVVFVLSDYQNQYRTSHLFLDDLSFTTNETAYDASAWTDDQFLDLVEHRAFNYFQTFKDSKNFALDRSTFSDQVSVGAIGFQLTAYCIGHKRGWADNLESQVETVLENLFTLPMGPGGGTVKAGYKGFFYHFLDAGKGTRKSNTVELSLYDTMLLMYGVLTAKECFPQNTQIQEKSQKLFDSVEWDWMVDPATKQFRLGWTPEAGFVGHVDGYTDEALLVDILALGSTTHPSTLETYYARSRPLSSYPPGNQDPFAVSWTGSLFNYFFASSWLDLKKRCDGHQTTPLNIWENNRRAIAADRQFSIDHHSDVSADDGNYTTYHAGSWGLTAVDNLPPPASGHMSQYYAFGALPTQQNMQNSLTEAPHLGTIAVYGAGSSGPFLPQASLEALKYYYAHTSLWSPLFGFGDAYSTDPHYFEMQANGEPEFDPNENLKIHKATWLNGPWVNHMLMGINLGPMLLNIENYRNGSIWNLTGANPAISRGVNAIFTDTDHDEDGYCGAVDCDDHDPLHHLKQTWYRDADNDGYSNGVTDTTSCTRPLGYKLLPELLSPPEDPDDDDPNIYPGSRPVRSAIAPPHYYKTLGEAYAAVDSGVAIESQSKVFEENLTLSIDKTVSFRGGYDGGFNSVDGVTTLNGAMTIAKGSVIVSDFVLK